MRTASVGVRCALSFRGFGRFLTLAVICCNNGRGGIRTHGTLSGTLVFKNQCRVRPLSEYRGKFSFHGSQRVSELVEIPVAVDSGQRLFGVCKVGLGHFKAANLPDHVSGPEANASGLLSVEDADEQFVMVLSLAGRCRMIVAENSHTGNA
jgi:hypothetical protein